MAQWTRHLPHMGKNLCLDPQTHVKRDMVMCDCNLSTPIISCEVEARESHSAYRLANLVDTAVNKGFCLKVEGMPKVVL